MDQGVTVLLDPIRKWLVACKFKFKRCSHNFIQWDHGNVCSWLFWKLYLSTQSWGRLEAVSSTEKSRRSVKGRQISLNDFDGHMNYLVEDGSNYQVDSRYSYPQSRSQGMCSETLVQGKEMILLLPELTSETSVPQLIISRSHR